MNILIKLALLGLLSFYNVQCVRKCYNSVLQKPIITALLDLHTGENCELVNYHGLQQLAILESTMKQINLELNPIGIELVLQIFDTCSTREGAQIATLRALVASKQTCMKQPLFLGFLGPENFHALNTVKEISKLFRIPHIVPYSSEEKFKNNIFNVAKYPISQHTKVIELFLEKLGLQRILMLTEDNYLSMWKAKKLTTLLGDTFCFSQPNIIKKGNIFHFIENYGEDFTAILAIIESPYLVEIILEDLKQINTTILISLGRAGSITWPESTSKVYLLQMISSAPIEDLNEAYDPFLVKEFSNLLDNKCGKNISNDSLMCDSILGIEQDWTVNLLQYGLLLYSSNIRAAYYMKCHKENMQGLCPKLKHISRLEWNLLLSTASFYIKPPQSINRNKFITFNMDINVSFVIMSLDDELIKIGEYKNEELTLDKNYIEENEDRMNITSKCVPFKRRPMLPSKYINNHIIIPYYDDSSTVENFINLRNFSHFQLIGIICGIGFGITIILTFVFYNVYRGFNIITNRSSGFSSQSST